MHAKGVHAAMPGVVVEIILVVAQVIAGLDFVMLGLRDLGSAFAFSFKFVTDVHANLASQKSAMAITKLTC